MVKKQTADSKQQTAERWVSDGSLFFDKKQTVDSEQQTANP
jgi:hypothetical protein